MSGKGEEWKKETGEERIGRQKKPKENRFLQLTKVGVWFQTLCFMNIPVFGFFYMLVKLLRKKTPEEERSFAAAYLIYRVLVLLLAGTILFILYQVGLDFVENILQYADRIK